MKKLFFTFLLSSLFFFTKSQQTFVAFDTLQVGRITVIKDHRMAELARKEAEFNELMAAAPKTGKGYRLLLLSTSDRPYAMKVRTLLLQRYPDQKVYMSFQPPNIKLKFGNFLEKAEAENAKKDITKNKLVTSNIYIVPETIEIKGEKIKEKETDN